MKFLHAEFWMNPEDHVLVSLDAQANVMLLDDTNFESYKKGRSFEYVGGWAIRSPIRLSPPRKGHWNVVIDLGYGAGHVSAKVRLVR
jgi:hypothetical protein